MKLAVRYFFTTFLFIAFCLLFIKTPAFAQAQPQIQPVNSYTAPNTNPDVPNNLHTWTQNVMIEVISAMTCQLAGIDPTNPSGKCLGVDLKTNKIGFVENGGGAVGIMGSLISVLYTPPIHTGDYVNYLTSNFGLSKSTYAAAPVNNPCYNDIRGIGFCGLSKMNLIGVWSVFRNIVYLLFILVFVIIGIAIMLRVKIDPRTVMTIQNQIPKIIIGLLMVTFSFAIAGFLIDIMYVVIYLFFNVFSQAAPTAGLSTLNPTFLQGNTPFAAFDAMAKGGAGGGGGFSAIMGVAGPLGDMVRTIIGIGGPLGGVFDNSPVNILIHTLSIMGGTYIGYQAAQIPQGIFSAILPGNDVVGVAAGLLAGTGFEILLREIIPNTIIFLIVFIAVFAAMIRLWFTLITAYVMILVDIIFAPLWIVTGLMPGAQSLGFSAWLRDILANLSAFPVTIAMFMIGKILSNAVGATQTGGQFVPPLVGNPGVSGAIGSLITIGVILSTPHVVNMTKAAFKAPKIDIAPIGKMLGVGTGTVTGTTKETVKNIFAYSQGTMPKPGETGMTSVVRRMFGR